MDNKMTIEVELPLEIELLMKASRELETLVRKRIELDIAESIKNDIFICGVLNTLLKRSDLTLEDANELDHMMKREMMKRLGWRK
ncbi:MAG: hypothetical protein PHS80_06595 [Methanothrix sp.]|nr:hypothetical protein [Methanothrix sp.]MDD4449022.1 hypothetical protein [Methanothrix sp.]